MRTSLEPTLPPSEGDLVRARWACCRMPVPVEELRSLMKARAAEWLVQAQMLIPQQRWVQPTLAIAHASALISTALWSHSDEAALDAMRCILRDEGLTYPKLLLAASAVPRGTSCEGDTCVAGQQVVVEVKLTREHAQSAVGETPQPDNPQGIYEAYCACHDMSIRAPLACASIAACCFPRARALCVVGSHTAGPTGMCGWCCGFGRRQKRSIPRGTVAWAATAEGLEHGLE